MVNLVNLRGLMGSLHFSGNPLHEIIGKNAKQKAIAKNMMSRNKITGHKGNILTIPLGWTEESIGVTMSSQTTSQNGFKITTIIEYDFGVLGHGISDK